MLSRMAHFADARLRMPSAPFVTQAARTCAARSAGQGAGGEAAGVVRAIDEPLSQPRMARHVLSPHAGCVRTQARCTALNQFARRVGICTVKSVRVC